MVAKWLPAAPRLHPSRFKSRDRLLHLTYSANLFESHRLLLGHMLLADQSGLPGASRHSDWPDLSHVVPTDLGVESAAFEVGGLKEARGFPEAPRVL